ncbi:MAG: glycosyltransferase family 4 protein [Gammaproteobacteria bacterium]|nr:glycosyltransferase family 4 protein [Gammaproteobacteria bacterium]
MKILYVVNQVPYPPDNGVRIVSHHAMRLMYEAGHTLALAVLTDEDDVTNQRFNNAAKMCETGMTWFMPLPRRNQWLVQLFAALKNKLFFVERYDAKLFRKKLKRLISDFEPDVIHFDIITMLQYRNLAPVGVKTIASINDSYALTLKDLITDGNYAGLIRFYRIWQYRMAKQYEANIYPLFDAIHVMTEVDALYLKALNPDTNTIAITNGVDESLFDIAKHNIGKNDAVFVGNLVGNNLNRLVKFLQDGWRIVHKAHPDTKLHIVGKLCTQTRPVLDQFDGKYGVSFVGYVSSLIDAYCDSGIAIVPVNKNSGIINKAIEAMAAGHAVVGFDKTFSGIVGAHNEEHFVACNDYVAMGNAINALIEERGRLEFIQKSAHAYAKEYFSWSTRVCQYEALYHIERKA